MYYINKAFIRASHKLNNFRILMCFLQQNIEENNSYYRLTDASFGFFEERNGIVEIFKKSIDFIKKNEDQSLLIGFCYFLKNRIFISVYKIRSISREMGLNLKVIRLCYNEMCVVLTKMTDFPFLSEGNKQHFWLVKPHKFSGTIMDVRKMRRRLPTGKVFVDSFNNFL